MKSGPTDAGARAAEAAQAGARAAGPAGEAAARRTAVVTGASTGIGNAVAHRLARAGWHVYATVRRSADADRVRRESNDTITPLLLDLTDAAALEGVATRIVEECGPAGLHGLVNNAGIAIAGPLEFLPIDELRRQLEVNVVAHVALTQKLMPALRRAAAPRHVTARIVFIGSIAGRSALPLVGAYSASKFALEAVADSWRVELRPWNIHVCIVEPGVIATPIWDTAARVGDENIARMPREVDDYYGQPLRALRKRAARGIGGRAPESVAEIVEQALTTRRPRARYIVGADAKSRVWLQRLPTRLRDSLIARALKRL